MTKRKIDLIAIDIDGTLVNSNKELTKEVKVAIANAREQGIKIVIATGRPLSGAKRYLQELDLDDYPNEYVISFNGAVVQTTNGQAIFEQKLSYDAYVDLEAIARKLKLHFHAVAMDRIYTAERDIAPYTLYNSRIVKLGISYRTQAELRNVGLIKAMFVDEPDYLDQQIKSPLFAQVKDKVSLVKTEPFYYEATAAGVDKGTGLLKLCDHLDLDPARVMAIGDEANDLPMIKAAGIGVAMGNAVDVTKAGANEITADCDHNGVAQVINKYL